MSIALHQRLESSSKRLQSLTRTLVMTLIGLLALPLLSGCAATAPPAGVVPVRPFDLQRYQGVWYEIARLDSWFERGLTDVTARYTPQADGSIEVLNRGYDPDAGRWRDARGRALPTAGPDTGSLKVSFFGPFYGGYHVAALDPDYQWALVIGADRSYCWILARTPTLSRDQRELIVAQARTLGIAVDALVWVRHDKAGSHAEGANGS